MTVSTAHSMRVLPALFALSGILMAPAARSQPVPPERLPPVEDVAARLVADGLLPAEILDRLAASDEPFPRTALVMIAAMTAAEAMRAERLPVPIPPDPDRLVEALLPASGPTIFLVDRLRAAGALSGKTYAALRQRLAEIDAEQQPARDSMRAAIDRGNRASVSSLYNHPLVAFGITRPDSQVFSLAMTLSGREEQLAPERWQPLLDSLAASGHLTAADRDRVLGALALGEAATLGTVLALLPRILVVRPEPLPADLDGAARAFADTLAAWLGRTGVAHLTLDALTAEMQTGPSAPFWTLVVAAGVDGHRYAATGYGYSSTRGGQTTGATNDADMATAVCRLVNKVLRDRGLRYRLATARLDAEDLDPADETAARSLVVAAVTAGEAELYRGTHRGGPLALGFPGGATPGGPDAEARLTTDRIAAHVALLVRLGLVTEAGRDAGEQRLERAYVAAPFEIVEAFGLTVTSRDIAWENGSPFGSLLGALAGISRGAFAPAGIEETIEGDAVAVAFAFRGQQFAANLRIYEDATDSAFVPFINRALARTGVDGQFLSFEDQQDDSTTYYLFVTSEQEAALADAGLLAGAGARPGP